MILLNHNIESVLSLGKEFGPLASTWKSFSDSWTGPSSNTDVGTQMPSSPSNVKDQEMK
jgi:hypothetical protein